MGGPDYRVATCHKSHKLRWEATLQQDCRRPSRTLGRCSMQSEQQCRQTRASGTGQQPAQGQSQSFTHLLISSQQDGQAACTSSMQQGA